MESQTKSAGGFDGYHGAHADGCRAGSHFRLADYALRVAGLVATLVAAVVMGIAKQDTTVPVQLSPALPSIPFAVSAKSSYSSAFVYFVVVNAIACAYAALSLALLVACGRARKGGLTRTLVFAGDLVVVGLLLSGNGAAAAIGEVGRKGNSHVRWNKICNVFGKFCAYVTASISASLLGSLNFVVLVLVSFLSAHRRSQ